MQELLIGSIAILLGSFIQGVSGFAFSLVVVPSLMMFFRPAEVVPVVIGLSIFLNTLILFEARRSLLPRTILPLTIGGLVGISIGIYFLNSLDPDLLKLGVGVIVLGFAGLLWIGYTRPLKNQQAALVPVGIASGLLHGAIAIPGPPVVLFLANQAMPKDVFRANLIAYFLLLNILGAGILIANGTLDKTAGVRIAQYLPMLFAGVFAGVRVSKRISEQHFRRLTLAIAMVAGVILTASSVKKLLGA